LPIQVLGLLQGTPVKALSVGSLHSAALTQVGGRLFTWGAGECGQLGSGRANYQVEPVEVEGVAPFASVSCGPYQTAVVTHDGAVYMCGNGMSGQLGNGSTMRSFMLTQVSPPGGHRVVVPKMAVIHVNSRLLRKWQKGVLRILNTETHIWEPCTACTLFKKHCCFCKATTLLKSPVP